MPETLLSDFDPSTQDLSKLQDDEIHLLKGYRPKNKIRMLSATSIFDGHDASINIFRRLLQARGVEVIHLGHNRSAEEIASAAVQEDVQGVAVSCYQGGHAELFPYIRSLLDQRGASEVKLFGGGGGVIAPDEITALEANGVAKIYSPEDGQRVGLEGIIGHMVANTDFAFDTTSKSKDRDAQLARYLTLLENNICSLANLGLPAPSNNPPVLGITGTGGAGKSSLLDEIMLRLIDDFSELRLALLCIDPSKKKSGGALLGDRLRINSTANSRVFLRSFATRDSGQEIAKICADAVTTLKAFAFDLIIIETSGIGQGDTGILEVSDRSIYVMTPEYGAQTQLEKIDMLDFADLIAVNKFERLQGSDALAQVRDVLRRSRRGGERRGIDSLPVFGTIANRFNDDGVSGLYYALVDLLRPQIPCFATLRKNRAHAYASSNRESLIPYARSNYLSKISSALRSFHSDVKNRVELVKKASSLDIAQECFSGDTRAQLRAKATEVWGMLDENLLSQLKGWPNTVQNYASEVFTYQVRGEDLKVPAKFATLAGTSLPRVALPDFESKSELAKFLLKENLPGHFPYTAGIFPFRRRSEDPKRQFAGEGGPERTNQRFHFLANHDIAKRLSTAFDSVTLYGADPDRRPDIYGKIGESGVSIAHLDDMKLLYSGFDLCDSSTSVSMTINGPAPAILAMFFNTAIDQQLDKYRQEKGCEPDAECRAKIADQTLQRVRGTVQADILKEDQAQNTCIFSNEFALKMLGDIQQYFVDKKLRNYYAISISGYHIAEAGANPITQTAFTLANGFTYVEYFLGLGLDIDTFAGNLAFFFSNGIDAEYAVIGRVARRIWAVAMRDVYGANPKSQKLKYHIQTSGRSLHAQEMDFNDIRTTLQALMALYDNCNSLHTNAFDEALTTPTTESVRRAMAIQLIINKEFGLNQCENVNQGSFLIAELTDLVEEAILAEFESLSRRGGVLGAMETQYQRTKIQEESIYYEHLKHSGEIPIVGVNTYVDNDNPSETRPKSALVRASYAEKDAQLERLRNFQTLHANSCQDALDKLKRRVLEGGNIFGELMETVRHCSLGQISETLYEVGGKYRRAM